MVCCPTAAAAAFQVAEYGVVLVCLRVTPSTLNSTLATPTLSLADAARATDVRRTVLPRAGAVRTTVGGVLSRNVAMQVIAAVTGTTPSTHSALPLQPVNAEPAAATALSVTRVPPAYGSEQSVPQMMPAGALVTVPLPLPALVTVSVKLLTGDFVVAETPADCADTLPAASCAAMRYAYAVDAASPVS